MSGGSVAENLFDRIPQMRETAQHPDNLFSPSRPLTQQEVGPIAPMRRQGDRAWTSGLLLPVLQFIQPIDQYRRLAYTYLHSFEGGRTLRKLTLEWSMLAAVTQDQVNADQREIIAQFDKVISAFFPFCGVPATNGVVVRPPHRMVIRDKDGDVETCRTPMFIMFVIDDDTLQAPSAPNREGRRSGIVLLGPDGNPARR